MSDDDDSGDRPAVIGWDIGGVNTKVARVRGGRVLAARSRPFELQRAPGALSPLLAELASAVGAGPADRHAVTMTAELSQMFRLKRDGVAFVLDAVCVAFDADRVSVFGVDGRFLPPDEARRMPLDVAGANWSATARLVAATYRDVILLDTGTTTTDIIPILDGEVVAIGRTDPARLASGELVYTGALRSTAEAIASHVPYRGDLAGVSAEGFALAGDVHLWRGDLAPSEYTVPTPDGRPATREFAGERLARVVCADREMLDDAAVSLIADALAEAQVDHVADAVWRVALRHPTLRKAVVTGLGAFIGTAAARRVGLEVVALADTLGQDAARSAPATAVALLYEWSRSVASAT
jgi:probable H4MPT-linked C1 transfer pathway protein